MRNLLDEEVNQFRDVSRIVVGYYGGVGDEGSGSFLIQSNIDGEMMRVIASNGDGWDHVSASKARRVPHYYDMAMLHRLFFKPDETAMQLHVPASQHVNVHPHCLHLWRPHDVAIPLPDPSMVG